MLFLKQNSISRVLSSLMMIKELANKVADTNANPYADDASNNELENLNTKSVKRGEKILLPSMA